MGKNLKLLDLFCGDIDAQKNSVYNKLCLLNVRTAVKKLRLNVKPKKFVLPGVNKDFDWVFLRKEPVNSAGKHSRLLKEGIITAVIVPKRVQKKQTQREQCFGIKNIQRQCRSITIIALPKTPMHGKINTGQSALRLSNYWGENV